MGECIYCRKDTGDMYPTHVECADECDRRHAAGLCLCCGKNPKLDGVGWCDQCDALRPDIPYVGYPPGGA